MCRDWFQCFMNNDFDFEDKENYATPKQFKDNELEALLDGDPCQKKNKVFWNLRGVDHTTVAEHLKALRII